MTAYKCSSCSKQIDTTMLRKRVRCPYCGSKVLVKERVTSKKIKAI